MSVVISKVVGGYIISVAGQDYMVFTSMTEVSRFLESHFGEQVTVTQ